MACACSGAGQVTSYVWSSADGSDIQEYPTLMQAKAKVMRKGGSYMSVTATPTGETSTERPCVGAGCGN